MFCWVRKLPGIRLWLHHICFLTIEGLPWFRGRRLLPLSCWDSQTAIAPAGSPALPSAHFLSFAHHSSPYQMELQKALSSPYPDFFKMHLKKNKTSFLNQEIYLKLQRLSQFLFPHWSSIWNRETHEECNRIALGRQVDKEDGVYRHKRMLLSHKNVIMPFSATWMDLESPVLNEVSQTEKDKHQMISLV